MCFQFGFDGHNATSFLARFENVEKPINKHIGLRLVICDPP